MIMMAIAKLIGSYYLVYTNNPVFGYRFNVCLYIILHMVSDLLPSLLVF